MQSFTVSLLTCKCEFFFIFRIQSFAHSSLWANDWFLWDRSTELLRRRRLEPAYWFAVRYMPGCPFPPILTDVPGVLERCSCSSLHQNVFSYSMVLSDQCSYSQKGFRAALPGGDNHIFLPTSHTFRCGGFCPERWTSTELWPPQLKALVVAAA